MPVCSYVTKDNAYESFTYETLLPTSVNNLYVFKLSEKELKILNMDHILHIVFNDPKMVEQIAI